ncbi:TPA: SDR family oxidoreductase [Legionella pneumophila]|nr:SDR family oxidoreductase [Legionella pneumophila]
MFFDKLFDVSREIVIITGVSGQLGIEYAKVFLERKACVIGLDVQSSSKNELLINNFPELYNFYFANVCDGISLQSVLTDILKKYGAPTVLINNAGIDASPSASEKENGPFESYSEDSWDTVLDVNLKGVYLCCQVFGSAMSENGKGSIINISSIYGNVSPDQSLYEYRRNRGEIFYKPIGYAVSKSGILNLTRYLAVYWSQKGVRVNTLTIAGVFNNQDQEFLSAYCKRIPIGKMANPDDYNGAVLFLASSASSYMTGANLIVDGGWTSI